MSTRQTTITLPEGLAAKASALGINISATCAAALRDEIVKMSIVNKESKKRVTNE